MYKIFIIISFIFISFINCSANLPSYFIYDSSNSPFRYNHIKKVIVDNDDNIWIINLVPDSNNHLNNNIYKYDHYKWTLLEDNPFISSRSTISDLKVSKTGSLYVAHNNSRYGLFKYSEGRWTQFMNGDSTNGWNGIANINFLDRNNLLLGTWRGILFTDSSFKFINSYVPPRISTGYYGLIWEILLLEDGHIWFTDSGGQGLYHAKINSNYNIELIDWYNKKNSSIDYFSIYNIVRDKYENICFNAVKNDLTTCHTVYIKDDSINIIYSSDDYDNALKIIGTDMTGSLWCSLPEKLMQYDLKYGIYDSYGSFNNTFPKCNINSMAYDSKNNLWFGTDIGLVVFNVQGLKDINSIEEKTGNKSKIFISPNPAREYIEIYGLNNGLQPLVSDQEIKIFNLLGECVLSVAQTFPSVDSGQTGMSDLPRIDVSGLPAGVYFVRVGDCVGRFLKI